MNGSLHKKYFIASIAIHLFIVIAISYMLKRDALSNKNFIIFGAHSRHTTKAFYKSGTIAPFVSNNQTGKKAGVQKNKRSASRAKQTLNKKSKTTPAKKSVQKPAQRKTLQKTKNAKIPAAKNTKNQAQAAQKKILPEPAKQSRSKQKKQKAQAAVKKEIPPPQQEVIQEDEVPATPALTPQEVLQEPIKEETQATQEEDDDDEIIHLGVVDAVDPVTRHHQQVISQEFNRLWHPPVGVQKGTECSVKITLGQKNNIENIDFIKKSGIPIYDLSILRLKLATLELPESLQGKRLIVVFHQ